MDTKPLERFATQARRDLLAAVDAQATAVLSTGSIARSERAEVVERLEAEIAAHGRGHVIDKVAYTWFNRIVALRFMDARGYTDAGVVSPAQGQTHGQPEILADAKRGNVDTDVVTSKRATDAINGLLDGTRRSSDAEGEAYALLLTEYCRYWQESMPFMFAREGDYTELLVPTGLLADGAILSRAREVLTEVVCDDVEVIGWLYQFYISERKDEVFAGFKKNKKAGADEIPAATQLFTPHWIVRYLVENSLGRLWLLNRPTSRLADKMDYYITPVDEETDFLKISGPEELTVIDPACGSGHMLTYAFDLLYSIYEEEGYAPSEIPSLILAHNLHGTEIDPRAGSLAAFALTMKARAKDRRFFNKDSVPKICVIEPIPFGHDELDFLCTKNGDRHAEEAFWSQFRDADTLGSLIQPDVELTERAVGVLSSLEGDGDIIHGRTLELARKAVAQAQALSRSYSVVTANPPYMGSKNMNARLAAIAKDRFPNSKSDLFAMFIERAAEMLTPLGYMAQVTMQSWMFLSSYEELRRSLGRKASIESLLHMDNMVMRIAFGTCATIWKIGGSSRRPGVFTYVEMGDLGEGDVPKRFPADNPRTRTAGGSRVFLRSAEDFTTVPGSPIAYWLSDAMRVAFTGTTEQREKNVAKGISSDPLSDEVRVAKGITTGANATYLRNWWEVDRHRSTFDREASASDGRRWVAADKGGEFRRWYGNNDFVIDWQDEGRAIIESPASTPRNLSTAFQASLACSKISSGDPAFRSHERGFVFTDAAVSLTGAADLEVIEGFLNSTTAREMLAALAPTLNFEVGQIRSLPRPVFDGSSEVTRIVRELTDESRRDWDSFESSWDFTAPPWLNGAASSGTGGDVALNDHIGAWSDRWGEISRTQQVREGGNNRTIATAFGLEEEVPIDVPLHKVSLARNVEFRHGAGKSGDEYTTLERANLVVEMISYAVGCMFGRYSLDEPGLILADQGATLQDYLAKVSFPTFTPDVDNVLPIVDDGWFKDDIVERFHRFLRATFGSEYFEENLRFVEESLCVKTLRDYFITRAGKSKFYDDHVQRYKKRPIYWMFSSPKGSFNALIYMHRYNPSTVSTVLNEYLREYRAKLEVALSNAERAAAGEVAAKDQKEADRLRKVLAELRDYEHDVLYPLATQQIAIDLDDGVKANYPKFYPALKKVIGLEAAE